MDETRVVVRDSVTDDGVERREVVENVYASAAPSHGDEQAGGAVSGGHAGAVVGGPLGPSSEARSARQQGLRPAPPTKRARTTRRSSSSAKSEAGSSLQPSEPRASPCTTHCAA